MAKPETQVDRVRRFCEKVIARHDVYLERYGLASTLASGARAQRDMARSLLSLLRRP